jgi:hypothetical protein
MALPVFDANGPGRYGSQLVSVRLKRRIVVVTDGPVPIRSLHFEHHLEVLRCLRRQPVRHMRIQIASPAAT